MRAKQQLPERLVRAAARFAAWRRSHVAHSRIPRFLWNAAVNLAREFGVSRTAITLSLNYGDLKKRVESKLSASRHVLPAEHQSFVELSTSGFPTPRECLIELEST